jgi:hypothetical protein
VRDLPSEIRVGGELTFLLEPREVRIVCFSDSPKDWANLKKLQTRTAEDFKPEPKIAIAEHPLLGIWNYTHNNSPYSREFTKEGICLLRHNNVLLWSKPFKVIDQNTILVDGQYNHKLQNDGSLLIEEQYKAKR